MDPLVVGKVLMNDGVQGQLDIFPALKLIKCCPVAADLEIDILMGECNRLGLDDIADELLVPLKKLTNFAA